MSALIIGSMAPDFENFFPNLPPMLSAHSIIGLFTFCLPLGLLVLILFHKVLKEPILSLLPENHSSRLAGLVGGFRFFPFSRFIMILFSLWVGSVTHLFLDAFTHEDDFFVRHIPLLNWNIKILGMGKMHIYFILQYGLSVLGIALLVYWYWAWYRQAPLVNRAFSLKFSPLTRFSLVAAMLFISFLMGAGVTIPFIQDKTGIFWIYYFLRAVFISSTAILFVQLLLFGIFYKRINGSAQVR